MSHICKACGHRAKPEKRTPSYFIVELLVWIGAIAFALAYHWIVLLAAIGFSLWRFTSARRVCPKCGSLDVIPVDSPIGQQLAKLREPPSPP